VTSERAHSPPIPAHSRPKDGVLSAAYAGIQFYKKELDPPLSRGVSGEYAPPTHDPLIPAHSHPKDGVLSQADAGIQNL